MRLKKQQNSPLQNIEKVDGDIYIFFLLVENTMEIVQVWPLKKTRRGLLHRKMAGFQAIFVQNLAGNLMPFHLWRDALEVPRQAHKEPVGSTLNPASIGSSAMKFKTCPIGSKVHAHNGKKK